jgi:hypothetical protein
VGQPVRGTLTRPEKFATLSCLSGVPRTLGRVSEEPLPADDTPGDEPDPDGDIRVAILIEAAVPAVEGGMDKLRDDELPVTFNRHATLHRVAPQAYTKSSALSALLLATGLLAEAEQMLEDGRLTA